MEKFSKKWRKDILAQHRLLKIIKLPEKTFDEGVSVSIFIFECGYPQNNREIFTCNIDNDGLERVKNQGRQDIKHKWKSIEDMWVEIISKQSGHISIKWINPSECLSYQKDEEPFEICEEDFIRNMMDFLMYKENIDKKAFSDKLANEVMYLSDVLKDKQTNIISIQIQGGSSNE